MDNINIKILSLLLMFLLVSTGGVLAVGVSSPYWENNPLEMHAGQTRDVPFTLVSKDTDSISNVAVSLEKSGGVAEITSGTEYTVQPGTKDTEIILRISVPASASIGDEYDIEFSVKPSLEAADQGNVQLGISYTVDFPVRVVGEGDVIISSTTNETTQLPEKTSGVGVIISWIVAIIIIITIIFWLVRKKRQV